MNMKINDRGRGIVLSYINTFLNMICGVFLSSFLLRILGDTEYGVYQTISSFANYLVLFEFGTGTVMTRNLSVCRTKNTSESEVERNISTIWNITMFLSVLIVVIAVVFYWNISNIYAKSLNVEQIVYAKKMFIIITIYLLMSFYLQTINGVILAFEKYSLISSIAVVRTVLRTVLLIFLILFWKVSIVIAFVDMLLSFAMVLYSLLYCVKKLKIRFSLKQFDKNIFCSSVGLCIAIFLQVIINQSNNNVDKFIIGMKMNPESVALYSVGMYIYSIFSSLTTIPISMYSPEVARNVTKGLKEKKLTDTLVEPSRLIVLIGGSVLFGFIGVGKQFITILYGREYIDAWYIAVIIMIPMFVNMSNGIIINVLDVMNKRIIRSYILLFTTVANIIMTIFFLDLWGIVGAAVATALATIVGQIIIMNIYYKKVIGIKVIYMFYKTYKGILIFQMLGCICSASLGMIVSSSVLSFIVGGVVYCVVSFGGFWLFGANEDEKKKLVKFGKRGL